MRARTDRRSWLDPHPPAGSLGKVRTMQLEDGGPIEIAISHELDGSLVARGRHVLISDRTILLYLSDLARGALQRQLVLIVTRHQAR